MPAMEDDPAYDITVTLVSGDAPDCETALREAIEATLRRHRTLTARISAALVDDAHIARLSELHLNRAGPTDVLAFDLRDEPRDSLPTRADGENGGRDVDVPHVDGEIVVSVDTAAREAHRRGHPLAAELALYAVHGTLHLLGYDDGHDPGAASMHEVEDEVLTAMGLGPVYRTKPR